MIDNITFRHSLNGSVKTLCEAELRREGGREEEVGSKIGFLLTGERYQRGEKKKEVGIGG